MKITFVIVILILTGCASIQEEAQVVYDKVSCRIDCRAEGKVPDEKAKTCSCLTATEKKSTESLKIEELIKKLEELNTKLEELNTKFEEKLQSELIPPASIAVPQEEVKQQSKSPVSNKKEEKDPLRDLLKED